MMREEEGRGDGAGTGVKKSEVQSRDEEQEMYIGYVSDEENTMIGGGKMVNGDVEKLWNEKNWKKYC